MVKRKKLSVETKMAIIRCFEQGESNSSISQKFNLSSSTVSTIIKNHKSITEAYLKNQVSARRLRKADKADLDDALYEWLKEQKNMNVPITRKILKEQAEILAKQLGYEDFVCRHAWLDRFKNRHKFKYGACENSSVPKLDLNWLEIWPGLKSNYPEFDIFVIDRTEMSYKLSSLKSTSLQPDEALYRCEVIFCTNMDGSEKRELIVIGKEESPEILEISHLPVVYYPETSNNVLESEIQKWDLAIKEYDRVILLLVGIPNLEIKSNLTNISVVEVPYTQKIHFVRQKNISILNGVISDFQNHFREILLDRQIKLRRVKPKSGYQLSFNEGLNYLKEAWDRITPDKIFGCFRLAGPTQSEFPERNQDFEFFGMESNFKTEPLWHVENSEVEDENCAAGPSGVTHLEIDCDAIKYEPEDENSYDLQEFKRDVKMEPAGNETFEDVDKKDETEDYTVERVSKSKAQEAIKILELFYESNRGINPAFKTHLNKLKGILETE